MPGSGTREREAECEVRLCRSALSAGALAQAGGGVYRGASDGGGIAAPLLSCQSRDFGTGLNVLVLKPAQQFPLRCEHTLKGALKHRIIPGRKGTPNVGLKPDTNFAQSGHETNFECHTFVYMRTI